jgi:hypothetical protein
MLLSGMPQHAPDWAIDERVERRVERTKVLNSENVLAYLLKW